MVNHKTCFSSTWTKIVKNHACAIALRLKELTRICLQLGYSSPAESGIMEDLGLSLAAVCNNRYLLYNVFDKIAISWNLSTPLAYLKLAVLGFWLNGDCWRDHRWISKRETSRSYRPQSCKTFQYLKYSVFYFLNVSRSLPFQLLIYYYTWVKLSFF